MALRWVSIQDRYLIILVEQKQEPITEEATEMNRLICIHPQLPAPHRTVHPMMIINVWDGHYDSYVRNEKLDIT